MVKPPIVLPMCCASPDFSKANYCPCYPPAIAKARAVSDRSWGLNSRMRRLTAHASNLKSGAAALWSCANAHAMLASSCALKLFASSSVNVAILPKINTST
eukprot:gnl/MRDRNA2_/MRDRNA2_407413_c0_seq1.p1 gnl/MRDRNA2_/MRDRNA2_407413_c0~~gnl/MRDRNA2_/MRDRNA2_407413_c0_seq1.p1  ORF type:complete len:101 (-),score=10.64 gnl/MRDRNA2_/MRDRNA2_407413_c0_seq1:23-325(-)